MTTPTIRGPLDDNQCDRATNIWNDDRYATEAGHRVAEALGLRPDPTVGGLYNTPRGFKTLAGLARVVLDELGIY